MTFYGNTLRFVLLGLQVGVLHKLCLVFSYLSFWILISLTLSVFCNPPKRTFWPRWCFKMICDILSVWVLSYRSLFSVWYVGAYHAVICMMICIAEHDIHSGNDMYYWIYFQILLNISLLKSFLFIIYVFKWHNLTILYM